MIRRLAVLAATVALSATNLPAQESTGLPAPTNDAERAILPDVAAAASNPEVPVAVLDGLLAKLSGPSGLRGFVQVMRGVRLLDADRPIEASVAVEEAVRLLPGDPRARLAATHVLTFTGAITRAADYWLEASVMAPNLARDDDDYVIRALEGRLREQGDIARADRIKVRMAEIGMVTMLAGDRSSAAAKRVEATFNRDGVTAAAGLVADVIDPDDLKGLYIDQRYRALWPAIDRWAGRDFVSAQGRFLREVRREWLAARDPDSATAYARQLFAIGRYQEVVTLFMPMLAADQLREYEDGVMFLAPIVSNALAHLGRTADAAALLERVEALMPTESAGLRLNLSAAKITQAMSLQNWAEVLTRSDRWLADARKLGAEINQSAVMRIAGYRACALFNTGRVSEADAEIVMVAAAQTTPLGTKLELYRCRQDKERARALVLTALADEHARHWALQMLQPSKPDPLAMPLEKDRLVFVDRLRADPTIRAAVAKVGRLLDRPVLTDLPPGFDPLAEGPQAPIDPDSV